MLIFEANARFADYYNLKIHEFLTTQFMDPLRGGEFEGEVLREEIGRFFTNSDLPNQDPDKCLNIIRDLHLWSGDDLARPLDPIHQFALYNFLDDLYRWSLEDDYISTIYFSGPEEEARIDQIWQHLNKNERQEFGTRSELKEYLHDIYNMLGDCFEDIDFITFPEIIVHGIGKGETIPADLLDDYIELIPPDILTHYQQLHRDSLSLFEDINLFLTDLAYNFQYSDHYKPLWSDDKPCKETEAQNYIGALLWAGYRNTGIILDHEIDTGRGEVDFRLLKDSSEKVLIEVKLASNPYLLTGFTKQLPLYMDAEHCKNACYLIICYSTKELERTKRLVAKLPTLPGKRILIKVLDATRKLTASKLR